MRAACLAVLVVGCAAPRVVGERPSRPQPAKLPTVVAPPRTMTIDEVGKGSENADWIDLAMPDDARVLSFRHDPREGRETWTLSQSGARRVLRIRIEGEKSVGETAYAGETTKDGMTFRLVEVRGSVRFSPERVTATCSRETICEDGKPSHRVTADFCTFVGEDTSEATQTWLAPGRGIDFAFGACPRPESTMRERYMKRPRGYYRDVP